MSFNLWSDEDRLLIPRTLGWSINFKFIAKKLGWIKPSPNPTAASGTAPLDAPRIETESREDRLQKRIQASRFEDER